MSFNYRTCLCNAESSRCPNGYLGGFDISCCVKVSMDSAPYSNRACLAINRCSLQTLVTVLQ